jgi:hypothetical protein
MLAQDGWREARHQYVRLPVQPKTHDITCGCIFLLRFDPVGERGRAIERHAERVVKRLAIRVLHHFAVMDYCNYDAAYQMLTRFRLSC